MKKKSFFAILIIILSMFLSSVAYAKEIPISVSVDGSIVNFPDAKPFIDSAGRVQTPAKFIGEALGAVVEWSGKEQKAVFSRGTIEMVLYIGKKEYYLNGTKKLMDTAATIKNGRTFVPAKYVAEAFGASTAWVGASQMVRITRQKISDSLEEGKDVKEGTLVNTRDEFIQVLKTAANTLQPTVILNCNNYVDSVFNLNNINIYGINQLGRSGTYENGKVQITIKIGYSQEFRISQASKNQLAKSRLTTEDKKVIEKINVIIANTIKENMTDYEKELALHDYLIKYAKFDYDNFIESNVPKEAYTPYGLLVDGTGVCQAYAETTKLLLNAAGIECEIITGTADGGSHAWNIVKLDGEYYMLDVTWDDTFPDVKGKVGYSYFNLTSEQLSKNHVWDKSKWPVANGKKYNYFIYNNLVADNYDDFKQLVIDQIKKGQKNIYIYVNDYSKDKYNLDFIFDYYRGKFNYVEPQSNSPVMEINLQG